MEKLETIKILNPKYLLRNDVNRVLIVNSPDENSIFSIIHPVHAMILSFFDKPMHLEKNIDRICRHIPIGKPEIKSFVATLIENKEKLWIGEGKLSSHFPEEVLIELPQDYKERKYNFRDFFITADILDMDSMRFNIPLETILMINTKCYTDCLYCYANRKEIFDLKIPFERVCEIIDEAKSIKMNNFDISGGEFFLYKKWGELLHKLISCGFNSTIPTKIPLTEEQIIKLKNVGINEIQISLDTNNARTLSKLLNVKTNYWDNIKETMYNMQKHDVRFRVNSIITSLNCDDGVFELIEFLKRFENFNDISIGPMGYTLYKPYEHNRSILPVKEKVSVLFSKIREKYGNDIKVKLTDAEPIPKMNRKEFFEKAICSGNMYAFYILPDGKVTICEELYWHPQFIIGDLNTQGIMDVWNSQKAKDLYYLSKEKVNDKSACKSCHDFDDCHLHAKICWREVIKSYGEENWDYPDPSCNKAPVPIRYIQLK